LRLLLLSTFVGPLGSGIGGGVELTVISLAQVLAARGHQVAIAAPAGSVLPLAALSLAADPTCSIEIIQVPGACQIPAQGQDRTAPVVISEALANAWEYARQAQAQYDLLVNFAYDWLPFYLTPFLTTPVAHFVSMGSLSDRLDAAIVQFSAQFPGQLGAYTRAQADTFAGVTPTGWEVLGSAIDIAQYDYCDTPEQALAWVGRISPEKGLADAVAVAIAANQPLKIFGRIEDSLYWQRIQQQMARSPAAIEYCGFLPTAALQKALGRARALLLTPQWVEAFGIVAIEALACGVPVIAYRRGGPAEIVQSGQTGYLVEPDNVSAMVQALAQIDRLDRQGCRHQAATVYSLAAWGSRFERWLSQIVSSTMSS
jgi:UDP-glucose:tetrahydrobiopterin glucosyltransferase